MDLSLLFLTCVYGVRVVAAECPKYQVPHNTTTGVVCCQPELTCPRGSQIKFCTANGERDTCEKCPPGWHGSYLTSSLDTNPEQCFQYSRKHEICALDDNAWVELSKAKHGMPCRCDEARCYHGLPSEFGCLYKECGHNAELDPHTGECRPCGPLRFNKDVCGSCLVNASAWRLSEERRLNSTNDKTEANLSTEPPLPVHTESPDTVAMTTSVPHNSEPHTVDTEAVKPAQTTNLNSEKDDIYGIAAIIGIVLVVVGNTVAIAMLIRRNFQKHVQKSHEMQPFRNRTYIQGCRCQSAAFECVVECACDCQHGSIV